MCVDPSGDIHHGCRPNPAAGEVHEARSPELSTSKQYHCSDQARLQGQGANQPYGRDRRKVQRYYHSHRHPDGDRQDESVEHLSRRVRGKRTPQAESVQKATR